MGIYAYQYQFFTCPSGLSSTDPRTAYSLFLFSFYFLLFTCAILDSPSLADNRVAYHDLVPLHIKSIAGLFIDRLLLQPAHADRLKIQYESRPCGTLSIRSIQPELINRAKKDRRRSGKLVAQHDFHQPPAHPRICTGLFGWDSRRAQLHIFCLGDGCAVFQMSPVWLNSTPRKLRLLHMHGKPQYKPDTLSEPTAYILRPSHKQHHQARYTRPAYQLHVMLGL